MRTEPPADFGDLLRQARRSAGLTQEELAGRAGISSRAVSDLERGVNRAPRRDTLDLLAQALDLSPADRTRWERTRKRLATRSRVTAESSTPGALKPGLHVPVPLTTFVGRAGEVAEVVNLLRQPDVRLLTLTGSGGVGKTRLALAAASAVTGDYPEGVWFINLSPLNDSDLVLPTIASTLNIRVPADQPILNTLTAALRSQRTLLLLDNLEHVVQARQDIAALVQGCPLLTVLTTSRVPLRLQAEQEYLVPPLDIPDAADRPEVERLLGFEAVTLFVQRAQSIQPGFRLTDSNAPAVAEICRRLDGIPLAIELAAARVRLLSPEAMSRRLESQLSLLTGGPQDLPLRQQTVRATVAWSYDLLRPEDRQLLRQLSVFRGGWTLAAAEAVAGSADILDGLARLVEHSLVRVHEQPDGEPRYSMLETIREFGLEQVSAHQEEDVFNRHCRYFLELAEAAIPVWRTPAEAQVLAQHQAELDNLRAALTWSIDHDVELFCQLSGALWRFYVLHGSAPEGREWLEKARARLQHVSPAVRARILEGTATHAYLTSDFDAARVNIEEALSIWQSVGNRAGEAWALHLLGRVAYETGDYPLAESYYGRAGAIYQQLDDPVGIADMLNVLGVIASGVHGDLDRARSLYEESLRLRRAAGDVFGIQQSLSNLGETAMRAGDFPRARALFEASMALGNQHQLRGTSALELRHLGMLALGEGDEEQAAIQLSKSIHLLQQERSTVWIVKCLLPLAELAGRRGNHAQVATIAGATDVIVAQANILIATQDQLAFERVIEGSRCQLEPVAWATAWERGRVMSLDEVIEFAVAGAQAP